jgi:hypothetical protein
MIRLDDLREAIAECEGEREPKADTCIKLAAFYIIRDHMYGEDPEAGPEASQPPKGYSYKAAEAEKPAEDHVQAHSGSEFREAADGKPMSDFIDIMDELMEALQVLQPKLYAGVIRKIKSLAL